ncbi:response regulator [Deinococcus deserti]|uniref:Putative response regulator, CheY n=1 Tax=Deinococcus deserti (strain DSM 17065 / CIP 109153 / LMG 22923 / VCD115) TaxID=546414 RepID=C1CV51_DEIDV|nr:response regulator [Deinococcus deserti]ACO46068.1 putative response regulator, CheY [Deinococcus deserti VCD115]
MKSRAETHLLVVDDEAQIRELLDLTLSMQGFRVRCSGSGPEAVEQCRTETYDVIVMDVLMSPWDGFESVRALHQELQETMPPVIFLSGLTRAEPLPDLGTYVQAQYLVKPFRPAQLVERIVEVLASRDQGQ